ncbi:MAG: S41 family peptidase [Balneolaceae bacterium]|nr:S41 family peptidase [Balneolaceae bacterium]
MSVKKFIAPQLTILIILSAVWLAGIDSVFVRNDSHQENLHKYLQAQRRVIDNYYGETNIQELYRNSLVGMVKSLKDSTIKIQGTPLDTTSIGIGDIDNLRDSYNQYEQAYLYVANNHPDEDMGKLVEESIRGMLATLDPHSVYIEPEDSEAMQEEFAGKFQGIGIQFNVINDTITVVTPISGGPSDKLGILSGDRIVAINDTSAVGYTNRQVVNRLRGEKGTEVDVTIQRPGNPKLMDFTIVRDDIPLTTVDTSYMLDSKTGYIKINRFAATTHDEFVEAVEELEGKGMERIVLDLRNNPGGYLSQAIAISEEFFPRGTKLVSTKSRHTRFNSEVYSRQNGILKDTPVIVLVNEGSASASEIVSGAIQDQDRGLVVGQRTFGKGLVQQQYELIDNSNIRVTISRYYTPSGRLIQKPFDNGNEEYAYEISHRIENPTMDAVQFKEQVPDSLHFKTKNGRDVFGGGGIVPDIIVQRDTVSYLYGFMIQNRVDFEFVRNYLDQNGDEFRAEWEDEFDRFREEFTWSEESRDQFLEMMKDKGLVLTAEKEQISIEDDSLRISIDEYNNLKSNAFARMKAELARQVWGMEYFYPVINDYFNAELREAMTLWEAAENLEILVETQTGSTSLNFDN